MLDGLSAFEQMKGSGNTIYTKPVSRVKCCSVQIGELFALASTTETQIGENVCGCFKMHN